MLLIGIVASGVLPVEDVAFENLTLVAKEIFPTWLYLFFVFGGAVFALLTTLNGTLSWVTRGLQAAARDGWLPEKVAEENKAGTPRHPADGLLRHGRDPHPDRHGPDPDLQHGRRHRYAVRVHGPAGLLEAARRSARGVRKSPLSP